MHCFYSDFNQKSKIIELKGDEFKHFKVLRIDKKEKILVSNGKGQVAECSIYQSDKNIVKLNIDLHKENYNESDFKILLFCGLIQDKSKIELICEKATELGVNEINFLITKHSQKVKPNLDRLIKKTISALKQSNRSRLPKINFLKFSDIDFIRLSKFDVVLADKEGNTQIKNLEGDIAIFVGPEAGFSSSEINTLNSLFSIASVKLSSSILRTETACISIISFINGNKFRMV